MSGTIPPAGFVSTDTPVLLDLPAGPPPPRVEWFLVGQVDPAEAVRRVHISSVPFRIGRRTDLPLCLPCLTVSKLHAEIVAQDGVLYVCDLRSTNGTYVNGRLAEGPTPLCEGDLLQFGNVAFRLCREAALTDAWTVQADGCERALSLLQFNKLMNERVVTPHFQPIVTLHDGGVVGYEILARSRLFGLKDPKSMFQAASQLNLEAELSVMLREVGIEHGKTLPSPQNLFMNTHPVELKKPGLLDSVRRLRAANPDLPMTLEIHEGAVTQTATIHELRTVLNELDISLAYDDFGAGQARLIELVEVPPEFLKFDMKLIQGIHAATHERQQMLAALVRMVRELGIAPLAEGIECQAESDTCRQIGFELGQGYFYGKPAPVRCYTPHGPSLPDPA
jgi:EAL domain-containing protein (putative c-di-GMP-specific phosphodiesterase class I)